jgi:ubiquinone/menaquinone biosynthesis C-methylase UbiE
MLRAVRLRERAVSGLTEPSLRAPVHERSAGRSYVAMAQSIPVSSPYSIRPVASHPSWTKRALRKLVRASGTFSRRFSSGLSQQLADEFNRYAPDVLEAVEGSARGFRPVNANDVRSELMYATLRPDARRRNLEVPRALHDRSFPDYYLEPFHGQPNGYLSVPSATAYDSVLEWLFQGCLGQLRQRAAALLGDVGTGTIVDFGTGSGAFLHHLRAVHPQARLMGVDLSPYMLALARSKHGAQLSDVEWLEGNITACPVPSQCVRGVTCNFVLHELPKSAVRDALREAARILVPGGRLVILEGTPARARRDQLRGLLNSHVHYEPFAEEFASLNLSELLSNLGFGPLETHELGRKVSVRMCKKR